jgi:bidirectional [NiFe] hydrogenase diaphorase subunit
MISLTLNGQRVSVEKGTTLLEAATFLGIPIPTLCHMEGLSPYGACRLCVVELLLASCPQSKVIQDLASAHDVRTQRFRQEHESCILCGLCVRMCHEQMMAHAIGFRGRGEHRSIGTPFDVPSEVCRLCGGCMYVCPACQLRCTFSDPDRAICGACANLSPPCLEKPEFSDMMCFMSPCVACEIRKS